MIIGKFKKQPSERLDYDVSYAEFFSNRTDEILTAVATPDTGLTLVSTDVAAPNVKVTLSGGTDGVQYKVTIVMTTTTGIIKEDEFLVAVKEI